MFDKKIYMKEYRIKNKTYIRNYHQVYYKKNIERYKEKYLNKKDDYSERNKVWYRKNCEDVKKRSKQYRIKNRDKLVKYHREYGRKNRLRLNEYKKSMMKKYPERYKAYRRELKEKQITDKCSKCGDDGELEFHHTDYKRDKGFTLCKRCHKNLHYKGETNE